MYKVEIDQTLCRIIRMYYQFGVWRNEEESDFRRSCRRLLYLIQVISFLIAALTYANLSDDKNQQIFLIEVAICVLVLTTKLFYLLYRKDEILEFLYDPIVSHCIMDYDESIEVNNKVRKILKFIQIYPMVVSVGVVCLIVSPSPIFTSEKMLPFYSRFNVKSDYDMVLYWVSFVHITMCCILTVVHTSVMLLIWYIMFNYSIEYKILGNQFRRLGYTTKKMCRPTDSFHRDLIGIVQDQQHLFETIERFRSGFPALFLAELFTGAICICCSTYNLAYNTAENLIQTPVFVVMLLYTINDIFVIMYLANEITLESGRLSYCVFESNWIEQSQATKKCIIILCEMIKQPQQLTIFIFPMNLEKFTSIVNGAYSMFNILKSFN